MKESKGTTQSGENWVPELGFVLAVVLEAIWFVPVTTLLFPLAEVKILLAAALLLALVGVVDARFCWVVTTLDVCWAAVVGATVVGVAELELKTTLQSCLKPLLQLPNWKLKEALQLVQLSLLQVQRVEVVEVQE
jgi:hypothetical protein